MSMLPLARDDNSPARAPDAVRAVEAGGRHKAFEESLAACGLWPLRATGIAVLQINVGRLCNQRCRHCHVDAGPDRREIMSRETIEACLDVLARTDIPLVDVTGGAPEMNPEFRGLVQRVRGLGRRLIDRSNLTILVAPGYDDLPEFLARHRVEVVASLPCYLEENVNAQRGQGVFNRSLEALGRLNALGYGRADSGLELTLVYNPLGPKLPPPQAALEETYRRELKSRYGIVFNRLLTLTNMPISRFLDGLVQSGRYDEYVETLVAAFNPAAAAGVMCRTTLSVDWTGRLFDCDFNQALELAPEPGLPQNIRDFDPAGLARRRIKCAAHCYGCTAGAGSGCRGAITTEKRTPGVDPDVNLRQAAPAAAPALADVTVVIPAYNEEASLPLVLDDLPEVGGVIVVDNASTDATAATALARGATVVHEPHRGYGAACLRGLAAVRQRAAAGEPPPGIVVFLDADYGDHPDLLPGLVEPIREGKADFVLGSRMTGEREPGAMPPQSLLGNRLACFLMRVLFGARYTDLGPFRAIDYEALCRLEMADRNFGWTVEMQIKAARARLRTVEIPVPYRRRIGRSKISGTVGGTIKASAKILYTIARHGLKRDHRPPPPPPTESSRE